MSDFPHTHTTQTTTTTVTGGGRKFHFDASTIKTKFGILRIVEIILSIVTFICSVIACTAWYGYRFGQCGWSGFVSIAGLIAVIAWLCYHSFHLREHITVRQNIPWLLVELICYAVFTALFITAGIALAILSNAYSNVTLYDYGYSSFNHGSLLIDYGPLRKVHAASGAGAFFAFAAAVVFGVHAFFLFREWRATRPATTTTAAPTTA